MHPSQLTFLSSADSRPSNMRRLLLLNIQPLDVKNSRQPTDLRSFSCIRTNLLKGVKSRSKKNLVVQILNTKLQVMHAKNHLHSPNNSKILFFMRFLFLCSFVNKQLCEFLNLSKISVKGKCSQKKAFTVPFIE